MSDDQTILNEHTPYPPCPQCGEDPLRVEIGTMTVIYGGMHPVGHEASPHGWRCQCANGHWFTVDGHPSGPPEDITVRKEPKRGDVNRCQ